MDYRVVCDDGIVRIDQIFDSIVKAVKVAKSDLCGMTHYIIRQDGTVVRHVQKVLA